MTLRELGATVQGMTYAAVSQAIQRKAERLPRDGPLRTMAQKAEIIMSHVQT